MAQSSSPWTGEITGDHGPYSASHWARRWKLTYNQEFRDNASVIADSGDGVNAALNVEQTSPSATAQVTIRSGAAIIQGYFYESTADENLTISANSSGLARIDLIILRIDFLNQQIRLAVLQGTPDASPVAPSLTQSAVYWEVPLAEIAVANGFSVINTADIDNTVRVYYALQSTYEGGTGVMGGVVAGDLFKGTGVETMGLVNLPEGHIAVGDGTDIDSIDHRIIEVYGTLFTGSTANVWTKNNFTTLVDPTGYASLSSGSLILEAGTYLFIGARQAGVRNTTSNISHGIRLYNATAAVVIDQFQIKGNTTPTGTGASEFNAEIGGQTFDSNGTDAYDAEFATVGTWSLNLDIPNAQHFYFRRIK